MTASMRPLLFAWQFLTAVPLSRDHHEPGADELADSMYWYPVVGMLLGSLLAAFDLTFSHWMSHEVVSALLIVLLVALTRGLHQDGLADTLDGLAGGRNPTDRLTIMRDPHIGAIGATGLFVALILRYAALVSLPESMRFVALLCMPAIGRWGMVVGAYKVTYARSEGGLGAPFLRHLRMRHVIGSTIVIGCLVIWAFGIIQGLAVLLAGVGLIRAMDLFCHRYFTGITGDTLGAMNEIIEVMFLLSIPFLLSFG